MSIYIPDWLPRLRESDMIEALRVTIFSDEEIYANDNGDEYVYAGRISYTDENSIDLFLNELDPDHLFASMVFYPEHDFLYLPLNPEENVFLQFVKSYRKDIDWDADKVELKNKDAKSQIFYLGAGDYEETMELFENKCVMNPYMFRYPMLMASDKGGKASIFRTNFSSTIFVFWRIKAYDFNHFMLEIKYLPKSHEEHISALFPLDDQYTAIPTDLPLDALGALMDFQPFWNEPLLHKGLKEEGATDYLIALLTLNLKNTASYELLLFPYANHESQEVRDIIAKVAAKHKLKTLFDSTLESGISTDLELWVMENVEW